jgi:hypothetical protein
VVAMQEFDDLPIDLLNILLNNYYFLKSIRLRLFSMCVSA